MSSATKIGIVILAAGPSSRMGKPKQLLRLGNKNLLQHTISSATDSDASSVIVVLGADSDQIAKDINQQKAQIIENQEWKEGMASSVRAGLKTLLQVLPGVGAVIFMVCDQPYVSAGLINDLINMYKKSGKSIVTCDYGEAIGPPALFDKSFFDELMKLEGDTGARKIILQNRNQAAYLFFPEGKIDIDTSADYNSLTT